jgi:hypothetical protein
MIRTLTALGFGVCLLSGVACNDSSDGGGTPGGDIVNPDADVSPTVICDNTYALCAAAECFVYNAVAYCNCDILDGESISAPFEYTEDGGAKKNICDLNAQGVDEGTFMASTFSLPADVNKGGSQAVYTCPSNSTGAYAQCDGGLCYSNTSGTSFPGFDEPLTDDEIICSCPITSATSGNSPFGYQFMGPFPCQESAFKACRRDTNTNTGTSIPVGAPSGVPRLLTIALTGENPDINECHPPP